MKPQEAAPRSLKYWKAATIMLALGLLGVVLHTYLSSERTTMGNNVEDSREKYPLIDPARHLIRQEHFLSTLQPLRERIHALVDAEKDLRISVYIEFLNTGANISVNNEERFWPASLAKIPVAMAVMGTIESGVWTLDQRLTLEEGDRGLPPSTLHENPTGTQFTVRQLLNELLIRSDNTAYRILLRNVPESELNAVREGIGLDELFNEEGQVSTREYSRIFRSLYTASYLNRENSQILLDILSRAEWERYLASPIPDSIPFPHKYGFQPETHTFLDSGIVYVPNRPYLITVMVDMPETKDEMAEAERAERIMHAISNMSLEFFQNAQNREL
jgi:beta-lactamase class A